MISGRDIVIVGQQPWDVEIGSNCKNIAEEMSKHNRVLYVNSPLDRITLYKHRAEPKIQKRLAVIKGKQNDIELIKNNLWNLFPDKMIESINWIKNQFVFEWLNKINNKRFASSIKKATDELGFKNIILFNDNDIFRCFYLKDFLKPELSIYYSRDYMLAVDYWKLHGEKLEPELIAKNDVCVANSTYLANYCKKYNPNSFYVGQGCELDIFMNIKDRNKPKDILLIPNPIIGYVGALQSLRLDLNVIAHIAESNPEWSVVLVGPEDDQFKKSNLHQIKNVYFIGSKDPVELPSYINAFDVCINPQIVSQVTIGNYPRKIDEYLAVGKPVVATKTEAMSIFSDHTYLAENKEEYVALIKKALGEDNDILKEERKRFASSHSWENSVNEIYKAIETVVK
ncbi:putative teichuronic acid biosynthesis glycosyltransferase TuaH [mine drainage metagenome]|uniref:Putative teichuronic acid biosynthesis glycosyltransferase TuaH n=1 Tax=mine drainage metagenome TaxID=410659 RepID=A0A1J5T7B7_9ZZZZ